MFSPISKDLTQAAIATMTLVFTATMPMSPISAVSTSASVSILATKILKIADIPPLSWKWIALTSLIGARFGFVISQVHEHPLVQIVPTVGFIAGIYSGKSSWS